MPPPTTLERLSGQVAQLDREVMELKREQRDHLAEHRRQAEEIKATASRRQQRLNTALALLSPVATAIAMRVFHLG